MTEFVEARAEIEYKGRIRQVDVLLELYHDLNHGADIDGNRGVPETFLENIEIEYIDGMPADEAEFKIEEDLYDKISDLFVEKGLDFKNNTFIL